MTTTRPTVTDGGLETDLIFNHGVDLPDFAAFPLLDTATGRELLNRYYDGYAAVARAAGAALLLETPTWRANPDWGRRLGYDRHALIRIDHHAVEFLRTVADDHGLPDTRVGGVIGPRGDGYRVAEADDPDYHRDQVQAFADAGADLVTAYTMTHTREPIEICGLAREIGVPIAISFTVETDGRLPSGQPLGEAIEEVDVAAPPDYFMINCAHPQHVRPALAGAGAWTDRIHGLRYNASPRSHAELDEATELDPGDPVALAADHDRLATALPRAAIVGGCCGTDVGHVAALWHVAPPGGTTIS